jgi:tRNA U34 5-methylaminomethyl-2-thiouridine-forming methyltransferase MnmC
MSDKFHLKVTGDGSHTLFVPELNENYHSYHGAYAEAVHVFIETGLRSAFDQFEKVNVFEVGFGTGLNATLAYEFASKSHKSVSYTGIEKFPLEMEIIHQLNYKEFWKDSSLDTAFEKMHTVPWNEAVQMNEDFIFKKLDGAVQDYIFENNHYHLIFFDAFAPEKQPDMWTVELFKKLFDSLQPKGTLVTYCAKGQFKRDLKAAGFEVETLPGPPGKREMVRGAKKS